MSLLGDAQNLWTSTFIEGSFLFELRTLPGPSSRSLNAPVERFSYIMMQWRVYTYLAFVGDAGIRSC